VSAAAPDTLFDSAAVLPFGGPPLPKIAYADHDFKPATLAIIRQAEAICQAYADQGLSLSLRQLYYQFVARGLIPNKQTEYKRLGEIIGDARMAGLLDWRHLEDRGRSVEELTHWTSPTEVLVAVGTQYRIEKWDRQPQRPLVLIEKDALSGVFGPVCARLDVPLFACKGYASLSSLWQLGHDRLRRYLEDNGQTPIVLHFGDHDPSGIDMTRDIGARLATFIGEDIEVERLALNFDQIDQYNPPPNPAKTTDSRYIGYVDLYGDASWELDALEPTVLADLAEQAILSLRDDDLWEEAEAEERAERARLMQVARRWDEVRDFVERDGDDATDDDTH
jgi:hypothetical protein